MAYAPDSPPVKRSASLDNSLFLHFNQSNAPGIKKEPHDEQTEVPQTNTPQTSDTQTAQLSVQSANLTRVPTSTSVPLSNGIPTSTQTRSLSTVTTVSQPSAPVRPKRTRQPARGRQSPSLVSPLARSTNHSDNEPTADGIAVSESAAPPSVADTPKVFRPTPYWPLPTAKPTTPISSTSNGVTTSTPVVKSEPNPTPSLKIRLPRLGSLNTSLVTAPPATPDSHSRTRTSTRTRTKKASNTRPRRSHRHASNSGSLNDTSQDLLFPPV